jgi:hypothetical protein
MGIANNFGGWMDRESERDMAKLEEKNAEKRLRQAWIDNTFPLNLEDFLEAEKKRFADQRKSADSLADSLRSEINGHIAYNQKRYKEKIVFEKAVAKKSKVDQRKRQTLARRITKLLNDYVEDETVEEE